ncbi:MAG: hypothetical protein HOA33_09170 [Gammaproteobacteria bacterium]|nr:hypothetical protein [Gammaproteobacteria bacterium]MBT4580866.1 hypothetical protein [Gammaproteobacteria bacterium]MBT4659372.1 hypothetical protein [Gammaproteobacteria bacterium]MBT5509900.1 hypothetical protein [Gammaproteobacteria bacterium]MBT5742921.1 hypothetical protein [Gammaproteobacteria bacterium]
MSRYKQISLGLLLMFFSLHSSAQLPTLHTSTNLLHIPVLEAQIEGARSYFEVELQASDDYSTFSMAGAVELDLLTYDRDDWKHRPQHYEYQGL